jgi:hypothetical protein
MVKLGDWICPGSNDVGCGARGGPGHIDFGSGNTAVAIGGDQG